MAVARSALPILVSLGSLSIAYFQIEEKFEAVNENDALKGEAQSILKDVQSSLGISDSDSLQVAIEDLVSKLGKARIQLEQARLVPQTVQIPATPRPEPLATPEPGTPAPTEPETPAAREPVGCVPDLIPPANGDELDNGRTDRDDSIKWTFDWTDCEGATAYHLQVIGASAINPAVDKQDIPRSFYEQDRQGSYISDRYRLGWEWKVRAFVGGLWGKWSKPGTFDVERVDTDQRQGS